MSKNFAIVENGIVVNVIIADDEFVALYQEQNQNHICVEYVESDINDENVARIGELYVDGKFITPTVEPTVPESMSPRQIRKVLTDSGMRQAVEDMVNQSSDYDLKDWWEYSTVYERNHPKLIEAAYALGLSDEQIDELFIKGASL